MTRGGTEPDARGSQRGLRLRRDRRGRPPRQRQARRVPVQHTLGEIRVEHVGEAVLKTTAGRLSNELGSAAGPEGTDETVEVRARTSAGDILIRRA